MGRGAGSRPAGRRCRACADQRLEPKYIGHISTSNKCLRVQFRRQISQCIHKGASISTLLRLAARSYRFQILTGRLYVQLTSNSSHNNTYRNIITSRQNCSASEQFDSTYPARQAWQLARIQRATIAATVCGLFVPVAKAEATSKGRAVSLFTCAHKTTC